MEDLNALGMIEEEIRLVDALRALLKVYIGNTELLHALRLLENFRDVIQMFVEDRREIK